MQPRAADFIQTWLDSHRAGEDPSLNDLCSLCEERVRQLVRPQLRKFPLVVQESQTTEVVNQTLLRLLDALRKDVRPASILDLERFLAAKIRFVLLDMHKAIQRRRRRVGSLGEQTVATPEDADDPVDVDLMVAFHEYVEALPPDEQVLFDVFYYQGKSKAEAAALLGLPLSTVNKHWVKARLRMRERLGHDPTNS
jgi:RNA polymerase sigma factor (sigma-70 family)